VALARQFGQLLHQLHFAWRVRGQSVRIRRHQELLFLFHQFHQADALAVRRAGWPGDWSWVVIVCVNAAGRARFRAAVRDFLGIYLELAIGDGQP
jgi:hypothetical protein